MNEQLLQQLLTLASITPNISPVNLSKTKSVNCNYVVTYEPLETLNDKGEPTGEFLPGVTLTNGETMTFDKPENEIFRRAWNSYTEATAMKTELLQSLLAASRAVAAPPTEAAAPIQEK
ncbi:MAG TPA: hypothetical protein VF692_00510 [Pyrinomonadaceae bacterium]|jgi:hypothetical protein